MRIFISIILVSGLFVGLQMCRTPIMKTDAAVESSKKTADDSYTNSVRVKGRNNKVINYSVFIADPNVVIDSLFTTRPDTALMLEILKLDTIKD